MCSRSFERVLLAVCSIAALISLSSCAAPPGPRGLAAVIRSADESDYRRYLQAANEYPKEAYFAWKAADGAMTRDQVAARDLEVSTSQNPFQLGDPEVLSRGAVIYKAHCMRCHGEKVDGRGHDMKVEVAAMDFHAWPKRYAIAKFNDTPEKWFRSISDGKMSEVSQPDGNPVVMPPFKELMSREQIWLAISYLMTPGGE